MAVQFNPNTPFIPQQSFTSGAAQANFQQFLPATNGPAQIIQVLQQLMQSLGALAGGWSGALGAQPGGFPQQNPQSAAFNAYAQQALQQFNATGASIQSQYPGGGPFQPAQYPPAQFPFGGGGFPQPGPYGGGGFPQPGPYGGGGYNPYGGGGTVPQGTGQYGGTAYTGPGNFLPQGQQFNPTQPGFPGIPGRLMAYPTDPNDFASYLQAQRAGGALNGQTTVRQSDAIPGTRFGEVQNSQAWNASVGRNYAYQFAAYAMGQDPLSPNGLAYAAQNWDQMSPDAKLFTQVASVFKGNLLGGPGNYDNPGLKQLLLSKGLGNFANNPGVGQTDVQTIGAITQALNSGQLSLQEVINSGTIDNLDRYHQVIGYVQGGGFNQDLNFFDTNAR